MTKVVIQASGLGSTPFEIYTADITYVVVRCFYHLYEDDAQLYVYTLTTVAELSPNAITIDLNLSGNGRRKKN